MKIVVNATHYRRFLTERARARSAERKMEKLREAMALPVACEGNAGEHVIVDGNGAPLGKLTIAFRNGYTVKPKYTGKLS